MARPREFDETQALKGAMLAFWQQGYAATSLSELEEATGLKRQSLYNAFGDKKELYVKSIDLYREQTYGVLAPLRDECAGIDAIRAVTEKLLGLQEEMGCAGCLVVKAAFDRQTDDEAIVSAVRRASSCMRQHFERVLIRAKERGELSRDADPSALADYLFTVLNGLSALAQTGASKTQVRSALELGFDALPRRIKSRSRE